MKAFSTLAAVSLLYALYWKTSFSLLSYQVWAAERGVELPERLVFLSDLSPSEALGHAILTTTSFFGDKGAFRGGEHPGRLHLARWLSDTPVYRDALEIVAEKARRAWWGEQIDLAMLSWGLLLAIEGRRRKIPHLWAFMVLAQLIGLSFAQNLFFIAMLLTPVPLPENVKELTRRRIGVGSSL